MSAAVTVSNLTLSYDRHPAVHHMDGVFEAGSLTAIAGPNGAGKSTLLKAIAGMLVPSEGRIVLECALRDIAYMPQAMEMEKDFPVSVLQMVCTGFWKQGGGFAAIDKAQKQAARNALATVGLSGFEHRQLGTLSAGQMQRALFARLLLQDAKLILLDEPFSAVDAETTEKLMEIIMRWHKEGRTIICVLHDLEHIRQHFPQCLLMARDCIGWGKSHDVLEKANLQRTRQFHEAWQETPEICQQ